MIILRQKEYGLFGNLFKKKEEQSKEPKKEYKCPSIQELQKVNPSIIRDLRKVDTVRRKPGIQKAIKNISNNQCTFFPVALQDWSRKDVWKTYILPLLREENLPEDTRIIPLIYGIQGYEPDIFCYDLDKKEYYWILANDYCEFESAGKEFSLRDWLSDQSYNYSYGIEQEDLEALNKEFCKLC